MLVSKLFANVFRIIFVENEAGTEFRIREILQRDEVGVIRLLLEVMGDVCDEWIVRYITDDDKVIHHSFRIYYATELLSRIYEGRPGCDLLQLRILVNARPIASAF